MNIRRTLKGRLLPGLTLVPVAALALGGLMVGTAAAQRDGEIGTAAIRDDFVNPQRIVIGDGREATPYPSNIRVENLPVRLYDVNVVLRGFEHANPDDVDVLVVAPNGRTAIIMSDAGGSTDPGGINITLDDEATTALPDSSTLTERSYQPRNYGGSDAFRDVAETDNTSLGTFDRIDPNGIWKLYVVDDNNNGDVGEIANGWALEILYGEAPVAVDDEYRARENRRLVVSEEDGVLANDNDGDPETGVDSELTARLRSDPRKGTVRLRADGSFVYTPDDRERGTDTFTYFVRDQDGLRDTGEVTITIAR